ncbi:methionine ABC transporter permease [Pseudarthrobacter sp. J75]|uniref:methionine ABC transporter permease n=1 Tax=unclassified Pseudarthrobacter TaxID=2647000 RepID=UPI002E80F6F6|nr:MULTISPECIES: methionine ABC transporter permease [unclassified Pseudarthrobacter]MEE2521858.1 methionine ABC transporter permease [Pseudarthrobacter sp. J47]MEE2527935.1 methionine ABC transporter permease [Pseudarthrobacter sp. J75]MEE2569506.1 methionine ABC transporter permease [Pseudarthrobacter sp. J64]
MIDRDDPYFWQDLLDTILKGTGETFYTVGVSLLFTVLFGLAAGVLLVTTEANGLLARPFGSRAFGAVLNRLLDFLVNVGRSIPFIILMILLIPFTRLIAGSFIGPTAAIVPLTIAGIPFFARLVEIGIREVPVGLVEAAQSLGATRWTILTKVMIAEAVPALALGLSTTVVGLIGYSAMVGAVGGGGLGDVAFRYGYQRYSPEYMFAVVILLILIVQIFQSLGSLAARRLSHR